MKLPFKHKVFTKLLITSSITIIATVSVLLVTITNYYSDVIVQREMDLNTRTLERVDDYFSERELDVTNVVRGIYGKSELIDEMSFALQNGYEDYFKYRLDRYTTSTSFTPTNITIFFNTYFDQHTNVNAVSLRSDDIPSIEHLFIYNHRRWSKSLINETVDYSKVQQNYDDVNTYHLVGPVSRNFQDTISIKRAINNPSTLKKQGELTVYFTSDELDNIVKKGKENSKYSFFIMNHDGDILYSFNEGVTSKMIKNYPEVANGSKIRSEGETYYINSISKPGNSGYTYISIMQESELNKLTIVRGTMWLVIVISTLVAIFITYSFMRNYLSRIKHIDASIREVEKGNLNVRIREFKQKDELTTISLSFNAMLDELNNYIDRFYILNIKQQQAELKALQSQINPHFLFNTLEVIRMSAVIEGSKTSSKMIYHLARLFRYTLESKETVPLHIELEHTNQYLHLMKLQHPGKLEVFMNSPVEFENVPIQKLILQPIIENYMLHGFRKDHTDNQVEIRISIEGEKILIRVVDNGVGISNDRLIEINHHLNNEGDVIQSIGLKNVHQRLKLKYGPDYGVTIQSVEGVETIISLCVPVGGIDHV